MDLLGKFDNSVQNRIYKTLEKLKSPKQRRHLKLGTPFFVEESGQYRIVYELYEDKKIVELLFVGTHKDYEKYYKKLF